MHLDFSCFLNFLNCSITFAESKHECLRNPEERHGDCNRDLLSYGVQSKPHRDCEKPLGVNLTLVVLMG